MEVLSSPPAAPVLGCGVEAEASDVTVEAADSDEPVDSEEMLCSVVEEIEEMFSPAPLEREESFCPSTLATEETSCPLALLPSCPSIIVPHALTGPNCAKSGDVRGVLKV